jgi:hypothetical protein
MMKSGGGVIVVRTDGKICVAQCRGELPIVTLNRPL